MALLGIAGRLLTAAATTRQSSRQLAIQARRDFYRRTEKAVDVEWLGVPELQRKLRELPLAMQRKIVRQEIRAIAKLIRTETRARAPVATGDLRRSIRVRAKRAKKRNRIGSVVETGRGLNNDYASFLELGSSRQAAEPFIRPAVTARREEYIAQLARNIGRRLEAEAKE